MLATRIIPTVLSRHGQLVKGQCFESWRAVGSAMQAARIYAARGVDELVFLDIAATPEGRGPNFEAVARLTDGVFTPVTVGGGVQTVEDVRGLLNAGADKVAICTAAVQALGLVTECADRFGRQAIVVSIDVRQGCVAQGGGYMVVPPIYPIEWAASVEKAGAGEILLQSVDRDGTMQGYDLDLIRAVSSAVSIPVIASGGCKDYEDMRQAIKAGASAVAAGALFQFADATPKGAAQYLKTKGIEVRL